jgi:hypothetical protein
VTRYRDGFAENRDRFAWANANVDFVVHVCTSHDAHSSIKTVQLPGHMPGRTASGWGVADTMGYGSVAAVSIQHFGA